MDSKPLVSVIMSVYNAEEYLKLSVESILNQTFSDFEFIIIDDCSLDSSYSILENYAKKDKRIKLIRKQYNNGARGFIENLNLGLDLAKGDFIARMDADDISSINRLEKQYKLFNNNNELFIVGSFLQIINESGELLNIKKAPITDSDIKKEMLKNICLYHPVVMFKKSDFRYREKMIGCEDYDLFFRMILANKKMANIPENLLKYRILENSISRKNKIFSNRMVTEMARTFYLQNIKYKRDSYSNFSPDNFNNILDLNKKNTLIDLKFACYTAIRYNKKDELIILMSKLKKQYPSVSIFKYNLISKIPYKLTNIFSKIFNPYLY